MQRHRTAICVPLLAAVATAGCVAPWDPADVMVVQATDAPGGRAVALLLEHTSRAALNNDTYKVVLGARGDGASPAAAAKLADTAQAVLYATTARGVRLRWASDA